MDRRRFLTACATSAVAGAAFHGTRARAAAADRPHRVAVIGHTGRGDYGHGLDTVWLGVPETEIVAVADPDAAGLARAVERLGLRRDQGFADFRAMLETVRPDLVAVCPRHADQHHAMTRAAIEAGARGIYVEKPFCRTPAEADDLVAACSRHGATIAVAHRNRWHPVVTTIEGLVADGAIGRLLEIRGRGKGDRRGGAEDLWVLGSHVLNLVHHFGGGGVAACSATLLRDGRPVTAADVVDGPEGLGPLAGDEVHARFRMKNGLTAFFDSIADDGTANAGFGLHLVGSQGIVALQCDRNPLAHLVPGNPFAPTPDPRPWIPISSAGPGKQEPDPDRIAAVADHRVPVRDLIACLDGDRTPLCDALTGAATVEMIAAVFDSHRRGAREVAFPLEERGNALALL